jgi:hypothetical protein
MVHVQGVIPSSPHAWLWVGDMAYMDDPLVDCHSTGEGAGHPRGDTRHHT